MSVAFTQLRSVCSIRLSSRATVPCLWSAFTRYTASPLNSALYSCIAIFNLSSPSNLPGRHIPAFGRRICGGRSSTQSCSSIEIAVPCRSASYQSILMKAGVGQTSHEIKAIQVAHAVQFDVQSGPDGQNDFSGDNNSAPACESDSYRVDNSYSIERRKCIVRRIFGSSRL